jgi:O-antigen/teichoic acid export membrane protein
MAWVPLIATATVSQAYLESGREGVASMIEGQWKVSVLSLVGPLAFLSCFAGPVVRLLFSTGYAPSVPVVRILCLFMICSALCGFATHVGILYVLDHVRLAAAVFGGTAAFNVASEIWLVRKMGITGAAYATGLSYLLLALATALASSSFIPLRIPWRFNLKVVGATLIAAGSTLWLAPISPGRFAGASLLWVTVFVITLGILKPLDEADSRRLCQLDPRLGLLAGKAFARGAIAAGQGRAG